MLQKQLKDVLRNSVPGKARSGDFEHLGRDGRPSLMVDRYRGVAYCRVCRHTGYNLTTQCPGERVPPIMYTAVRRGLLDYDAGMWHQEPSASLRNRAVRLGVSSCEGPETSLLIEEELRSAEARGEWVAEFGPGGDGGDDA